jgi:hypothetical protein
LVRSAKVATVGAVLLCASYAAMLVVLPVVSPLVAVRCAPATPAQAPLASSCFSSLNPVYPVVFLLSVAGTVALFFGWFGRRFIVGPVFVAGMFALEYGLAGTVSALFSGRSGVSASPLIFAPLVAIGAAAVGLHAYRWLHPRTG